ncbi:MAG: UPF0175 family protein [Phycisphaeraceae bacterium]|nr:UPF0175 family protein [Phycisphaeraceae bacterium]
MDIPESALSAMRQDAAGLASDMRLAAAAKWYELGRLSQGRAAELAGLSRQQFIDALHRMGVSALQVDADELNREAGLE